MLATRKPVGKPAQPQPKDGGPHVSPNPINISRKTSFSSKSTGPTASQMWGSVLQAPGVCRAGRSLLARAAAGPWADPPAVCPWAAPSDVRVEAVRWRKPFWFPRAKTKMFKIPPRTVIPKEESLEIERLYKNYRTNLRSIRMFLAAEEEAKRNVDREGMARSIEGKTQDELEQERENEEWAMLMSENDAWNAKVATAREARLEKEREARLEKALEGMQKAQAGVEEKRREMEQEVLAKINHPLGGIIPTPGPNDPRPDALDRAIQDAIDSTPVDYNFSIDLQGNLYYGRETRPDSYQQGQAKVQIKGQLDIASGHK